MRYPLLPDVWKGVVNMGVYIPNMDMPKRGHTITITIVGSGQAYVEYFDCRPHVKETIGYTAVPVPPHYDLIDHNALKIAVMDCDAETRIDFLKHAMDCINKAPVVIPSDMPTYEAEEGE